MVHMPPVVSCALPDRHGTALFSGQDRPPGIRLDFVFHHIRQRTSSHLAAVSTRNSKANRATGFASEARSFQSTDANSRCGKARMCRTTASCGPRTDTTRSRRSPPAPAFPCPLAPAEPSWPPSLGSLPSCRGSHNSGGSFRCKNEWDPHWYHNHLNGGTLVGRAGWWAVRSPALDAKSSPAWTTACSIGS